MCDKLINFQRSSQGSKVSDLCCWFMGTQPFSDVRGTWCDNDRSHDAIAEQIISLWDYLFERVNAALAVKYLNL